MLGRMLSPPRTGTPVRFRWRNRIAIILVSLAILAGATYMARCALLLNIARIVLNRDSELMAQERADSVAISFAVPPPAWISPMKNQMNNIWDPIKANGVNYYMFAGPANLVHTLQRTLESIIALLPGVGRWVRYQTTGRLSPCKPGDAGLAGDSARSTFVAIGDGRPQTARRCISGHQSWEHRNRWPQLASLARKHAKPQ